MKLIKLSMPTIVDDVVRNPIEGALTVTDAEAKRLADNNLLDGEPEDVPDAEDDAPATSKRAAK